MCAANIGRSCGSGKEMGGAYAGGAHVDQWNPDNLPAMMEAAKEYGKY